MELVGTVLVVEQVGAVLVVELVGAVLVVELELTFLLGDSIKDCINRHHSKKIKVHLQFT